MAHFSDTRANWRPTKVPGEPGVYRFRDGQGRVLYIGKAKSLRSRLSNYFGPLERLAPRTQRMLQLGRGVDWTVVGNDIEALILEHTWINEFQPPFNVQFRDDKTYPYLAVTLADEAPKLIITRNRKIKGAQYFGPYPKVWAVRQLLTALQQAFPMRTCNDGDYERAMRSGKPCLAGQIGRCHGPCSGEVSIEEHRAQVNKLLAFLQGQDRSFIRALTSEMKTAAAAQEYEKAATLRDQLAGAEQALEQNVMVLKPGESLDVFGFAMDELSAAIHMFVVRDGRIRGEHSWVVDIELDNTLDRLAEFALQSAYDTVDVPAQILVPSIPQNLHDLVEALRRHRPRGGNIQVTVPERGDKKRLLDRANVNAAEQLNRYKLRRAADIVTRTDALAEIQEALSMQQPPLRMECIDVSHLQGTNVVASLVVFEDGLPAKNEYRKYAIEHTRDDTESIYQVVSRRAQRLAQMLNEEGVGGAQARRAQPQLIVVDGGLPQVNAAYRALTDNGMAHIMVCGLAKRMEEIWLAGDQFPVILPRSSEALFVLQRLRDEAHRVAIQYQRTTRKRSIHSTLTEIPGLGPQRAQQLLTHFGSLTRLRKASPEEIMQLPGFGEVLTRTIVAHLHEGKQGSIKEPADRDIVRETHSNESAHN